MKSTKYATAAVLFAGALQVSVSQAASPSKPPPPPPPLPAQPVVIPHFIVQNNAPAPTGGEVHIPDGRIYHGDVFPNGTFRGGYNNNGNGGSITVGPSYIGIGGTITFP